ncbi:MAG: hypothetical protein ACYC3L_08470 [Gemmatimonadaceae bacterium]
MTRRLVILAAAVTLGAATGGAQETLLPRTGWGMALGISAWHFTDAIPQTSGAVADVAEVAIPFRVRAVSGRWNFDLSGAGAIGAVHLKRDVIVGGPPGDKSGSEAVTIAGPTDLKLRVTGPVFRDNTLVTVGLNLPTGKTRLNSEETSALQAIGAPALRMPVGAFGAGLGATVGVIQVVQGNEWALAFGASAEQRTEYSPIAIAILGGKSETQVKPGTAAHVTVGYDRPLGEGRWSLLFVGDIYSQDQLTASGGGLPTATSAYTLGPQYTVSSVMQFAASRWREASFSTAARMRSEFSDATGAKVPGSSATYLEAALGGVRGGSTGAGFIVGADARWQSGMTFTDALVGAASTAAGVTLGVERAGRSTMTRWTLHGQYGTFDTGRASTTGMGVTLGLSIAGRREVQ